jgi:hypothetical protein
VIPRVGRGRESDSSRGGSSNYSSILEYGIGVFSRATESFLIEGITD